MPIRAPLKYTFIAQDDPIEPPDWVVDLDSFRRWTEADDFPEQGRICYFREEVWIDMSLEQLFSHVLLKGEIATGIMTLVKAKKLGIFWPDGARYHNDEAGFSVVPDGLFASYARQRSKQVRLGEGMVDGFLRVEGSVDMVLEVVSTSSVRKDNVVLAEEYWKAGVSEYWLVDARQPPLSFDIFRHTDTGYVPTRKVKGWLRSPVFDCSFRLTQSADELGHPTYTLESR